MDWREVRDTIGLPVFPIRIIRENGKWFKRPLTPHAHQDAHWKPESFGSLWETANGFGIPMGKIGSAFGLYSFDLDDYKTGCEADRWLKAQGVPMGTREHQTISGGRHLIYSLPSGFYDLPNRTGIVKGLDARGEGGWLAFGQGYSVIKDTGAYNLPKPVCEAILRDYKGGPVHGVNGAPIDLGVYHPPNHDRAMLVWQRLIARDRTIRTRVKAAKVTGDMSRSGFDHSVAAALALNGVDPDTITYILMHIFEHGACSDPSKPERVRLRAAQRSIAKGMAMVEVEEAQRTAPEAIAPEMSATEYTAWLAANEEPNVRRF